MKDCSLKTKKSSIIKQGWVKILKVLEMKRKVYSFLLLYTCVIRTIMGQYKSCLKYVSEAVEFNKASFSCASKSKSTLSFVYLFITLVIFT